MPLRLHKNGLRESRVKKTPYLENLKENYQSKTPCYELFNAVEIIDSKIWIHRDGTEDGIASELLKVGIPKERIVLGFKSPRMRKHTGFAVA